MNSAPPSPPGERPLVSLVIPMLNERGGVKLLFDRLRGALAGADVRWEIVIVDDGSTDGTREAVVEQLQEWPRWQLVVLARNFGQQPAYRAGLEAARGDAVVFLDAALQDPPELISQLVARWREGFKVVTACRTSREERGWRLWQARRATLTLWLTRYVVATMSALFGAALVARFPFWGRHLAPLLPFLVALVAVALRLLAARRVVWWCADAQECAEYYGLTQRRAEELGGRLVNAYLPKAETAEQWPAPDVVFLSKADIHDPQNLLSRYREKHRLQAALRLPAFEVFARPDTDVASMLHAK